MRLSNEKDLKTEAEMEKERDEYMKNVEANIQMDKLKGQEGPLEEVLKRQLAEVSL